MGRMSLNYCSCQKAPRIIRYVLMLKASQVIFLGDLTPRDWSPRTLYKVSELEPLCERRRRRRRLMQCKNLLWETKRRRSHQPALIASQVDGRVDESRLTRKRGSRENKIHVRLQTHLLLRLGCHLWECTYFIYTMRSAASECDALAHYFVLYVCAPWKMLCGIILIKVSYFNWNASADTRLACLYYNTNTHKGR